MRKSIDNYGYILLASNMQEAIDVVNDIAIAVAAAIIEMAVAAFNKRLAGKSLVDGVEMTMLKSRKRHLSHAFAAHKTLVAGKHFATHRARARHQRVAQGFGNHLQRLCH